MKIVFYNNSYHCHVLFLILNWTVISKKFIKENQDNTTEIIFNL